MYDDSRGVAVILELKALHALHFKNTILMEKS